MAILITSVMGIVLAIWLSAEFSKMHSREPEAHSFGGDAEDEIKDHERSSSCKCNPTYYGHNIYHHTNKINSGSGSL